MKSYTPPINIVRQSGVTLIEVLVALLVLGIGLLAVAALQATSIRGTYSSMERSMALIQVENFIELVRSNPAQGRAGAFVVDDCAGSASLGLDQWLTDVAIATRSDSCPTVTWDGEYYVVTIAWNDERSDSNNEFVTRVMP
jgi:type IV pilus modification protein PilV